MDFTMYETLLQLPLFQGLSKNDITEILTAVKFHFKKISQGDCIYRQDEMCREIAFLLGGTVVADTVSFDKSYMLCEPLPVPYVIELYSLYGINPRYQSSYRAVTDANVLTIDKQYLFDLLSRYETCGINYSNIVCTRSQYLYKRIWQDVTGGLRERFVQFVMQHCHRLGGAKILRIKMEDLAALLYDRRINVSRMLNELQDEGLVCLRRKEIEIPALEKLF